MILITIPDARLCADPRMGDAGGKPVANLRVASNARVKIDGEWTSQPMFLDVALWRGADTIEAYFRKGSPIIVHGDLRPRSWTDRDGVTHEGLEVANADWAFPPKNDGMGEAAPPQRSEAPQRRQAAPAAPAQGDLAGAFADDDVPF